jgi:hypothetical protein
MILLPDTLRATLRANAATPDADPCPVLKLFSPLGSQTWLATELDENHDTLFGLADLGFGCPELGCFSLREIASLHLPSASASSATSSSRRSFRSPSGPSRPA